MDLLPYVARLNRDLRVAAEAGGEETVGVAEQLAAVLESSVRLVLLDALVEAAGDITRDLTPGSVEVRLRGREVDFAVNSAPASGTPEPMATDADATGSDPEEGTSDGGTARLSLRLPERLKSRVEQAADAAGLSVNAWLVRSINALVETPRSAPRPPQPMTGGQRHTGWVR